MLPLTRKMLMDWAGPRVFHEGKALFESERVREVEFEPPFVRGSLSRGDRSVICQFELLPDGKAESQCPCRDNRERGIICAHVIALGLELIRRHHDPAREARAREEMRRAARLAHVDESAYLERAPRGTVRGAIEAELRIELAEGWQSRCSEDRIPIICMVEYDGQRELLDQVSTKATLGLLPRDEAILFVLEDISEGPAKGHLEINASDFINLLNLHKGHHLYQQADGKSLIVNAAQMASVLRADLDRENGELILMVHTELPFMDPDSFPVYIVSTSSGWVYDADNFWHLENHLPAPLHSIYRQPVCVERASVPRFFWQELPILEEHIRVETDVSIDLFSVEPAEPAFRLVVRGSPASLAATLYAEYGATVLVAGKPDPAGHFALPDPDDILRYTIRNPEREAGALAQLSTLRFSGGGGDSLSSIVGCREVLNFLGSGVPKLRRLGWRVTLEGRVEPFMGNLAFATPVVHVQDGTTNNWFEVRFEYEDDQGQSLSEGEIQRALLKGESYVERNGVPILLDADAISAAKDVFRDCAVGEGSQAGSFRMDDIYLPYVSSSLDALDGIDVEASGSWVSRAKERNGALTAQPIVLPQQLDQTLRIYQKDGIRWIRFLETHGFCGILADEMGLGKTVQTLAWLQLQRSDVESRDTPALIVCPTSLVENWADEATKFVPELRVMMMSGPDRHDRWSDIEHVDAVITSYALMRRDVEKYVEYDFSAIVLDEAQHIKNRSTQNSVAAKRLHAANRLVLTGTPIENSVSDLWSIMDFLMPGYLGKHDVFRQDYEQPIAQGGPDASRAQAKLRRKLHPFLLRREKKEVAKDLPPKIERLATCSLTRDQQLVYQELLETSQRRIHSLVDKQGFNRSRMEILKTLLRLRQICCHLDLLKLPDLDSKYPSGKMELFFELLDEALDGGHRVLVFSQFTSMLAILRRELEKAKLRYCYLDGATKERLKVVREFNTNHEIPVFLMSLKAGGTGLNLTGADMVIHFDPWWNPAVEDQATDRAHRIGQHRTVYSIKLITKSTVEEKVLAMQRRKKAVINAALSKQDQVVESLTWDTVQELLAL